MVEEPWDVCVVGGGPAGLAVAAGLAGSGCRTCIVDVGDHPPGGSAFPPVRLDAEDPNPNGNVNDTHAAGIGGTARQWSFQLVAPGEHPAQPQVGCRYAPLQPLDLQARAAVGTPGWPVDGAELDPWYRRAQELCGLGPFHYDADSWSDPANRPLPLDPSTVATSMFQFGPASAFTDRAAAQVAQHGIRVLTDTAALWLELDPQADRVTGVAVAGPEGTTAVRARQVVLAAGGMETVRLLLETGRRHGRAPGDHAGHLGRYFMEHPLVRGGLLVTQPGQRWIRRLGLYGTRRVEGTYVSAKLTLTDEVVQREGLLACSALLVPRDRAYAGSGAQALSRLRSPSGRQRGAAATALDGLRVLAGGSSVVRAALAQRGSQPTIDRADWEGPHADERYSVFEVLHQTEQSPDPDNRLTLGAVTDRLGRSELRLRRRWSVADQRRIARSRDLFGSAFERAGIGRLVNTDWDGGRPKLLGGTHHHMGMTRMSARAGEGVVDPDCRVHGWENLHVACSSVFPSGGFVNPTLTVVALGLRLGARLADGGTA